MSEIAFKCIGCGENLVAPQELLGQDIRCDKCNVKQTVTDNAVQPQASPKVSLAPEAQAAPQTTPTPKVTLTPEAAAPQSNIDFHCIGCGGSLSAPAELQGKDIRCDKCDKKQPVPAKKHVATPATPVVPPSVTPQEPATPVVPPSVTSQEPATPVVQPTIAPQTPATPAVQPTVAPQTPAGDQIVIQPSAAPITTGLSLPKTTPVGGNKGETTTQRKGETTTQRKRNISQSNEASQEEPAGKGGLFLKLVVALIIFGVAGFGTKVFLDNQNKDQTRDDRAEELRKLEYERRVAWDTARELGETALSNKNGYEPALKKLNNFIEEHENSDFTADAQKLADSIEKALSTLSDAKDAERAAEEKAALDANIARVMRKLKVKTSRLTASKDYEGVKAIYRDYDGEFASESQSQRNAAISEIDEKIDELEKEKRAKLLEKRDQYVFTICDGMINKKSYDGLKDFLGADDVEKFSDLKEIVNDYVKIKASIIKKYQRLKGRVVVITVKGKKGKYKISNCDKEKITAGIKLGSKLISTRINLKDIPVEERIDGISGHKDESIALYCVVVNMSADKKAEALKNVGNTGILKKGLSRALEGN